MASPQKEEPDKNHSFRDFGGINTQANRENIGDDEFSWLENVMPIGDGNMPALYGPVDTGVSLSGATCYFMGESNIGNVDYMFMFCTDGSAFQINLTSYAVVKFANAGTFNGTRTRFSQWANDRILIIDSGGYYSWDTVTLVNLGAGFAITASITLTVMTVTATAGYLAAGDAITGAGVSANTIILNQLTGTAGSTGTYTVSVSQNVVSEAMVDTPSAPTTGTTIAVFSGLVWIGNGRTVVFSAPGSYTDFTQASFGGSFVVDDPTLHSTIQQLLSANGFLYVIGTDSVNVVSDVRVSSSTTVFSNLNLVTTVGTMWPDSVTPYYRTIWMATKYGFYGITGNTATKGSDALDGIFQNLAAGSISSGTVIINNILCLVFSFQYADLGGNRTLMAVHFNKKWFLASQGVTFVQIAGASPSAIPTLYGTDGAKLYKLFSDTGNLVSPNQIIQTRLWDMGTPLQIKQTLKVGMEIISPVTPISISGTLDTEYETTALSFSTQNGVTWVNNLLAVVLWQNNALVYVPWAKAGYMFPKYDIQAYGNYVGVTLNSTTAGQIYAGIHMQYKLRTPWWTPA